MMSVLTNVVTEGLLALAQVGYRVQTLAAAGPRRLPGDPRAAPVTPSEISDYFNQRSTWDGTAPMLLCLAAVSIGVGLIYAVWLFRHRDRHPLPGAAYRRVAGAMGLNLIQQWHLWRVARQQGLPSTITLMLCPGTFDAHIQAYLSTCHPRRVRRLRAAYDPIRQRLFAAD